MKITKVFQVYFILMTGFFIGVLALADTLLYEWGRLFNVIVLRVNFLGLFGVLFCISFAMFAGKGKRKEGRFTKP